MQMVLDLRVASAAEAELKTQPYDLSPSYSFKNLCHTINLPLIANVETGFLRRLDTLQHRLVMIAG
jgi:hypothetical protein